MHPTLKKELLYITAITLICLFVITLALYYYPRPKVSKIEPAMLSEEFCPLSEEKVRGYCVLQ
jgi:hypothetical protein